MLVELGGGGRGAAANPNGPPPGADTLAALTAATPNPGATLYPPLADLRSISRAIAIAILVEGSKQGWATTVPAKIDESVDAAMWEPAYRAYVPA